MDILIIIISALLLLAGIAGCILPVLPGLPIAFGGLLLADWHFNFYTGRFLWIMFAMVIIISILDYYLPIWTAKRFGATRYGVIGSFIGMLLGIFLTPVGMIMGTIIGAIVGDLLAGKNTRDALRSGLATVGGTFISTGIKLVGAGIMTWHFVKSTISYYAD
ncbi:MAG: DUF456 domain-containing protein [Bacteroidetes bacterium]|nr:DUF456 domain-containing protein [Bacteroidota bacterium]MBX7238473.1 DUF456 domain-containing protein [Bacteroidia bacterium]HMW09450.1 DUF456 domain-containing protein [Bacteroidia bacterium]HMY13295.1 DUF456 domain-containing protein [Bacteroidia bacterium]HMY64582.1 DUF456 domain-containing protein [Bacteroidia bacterium]